MSLTEADRAPSSPDDVPTGAEDALDERADVDVTDVPDAPAGAEAAPPIYAELVADLGDPTEPPA